MNADNICFHCYVTGKVQGVWFRANTKMEADKLNLTGWVRNLSDGRVEVFVCGQRQRVQELVKWLSRGPDKAQVMDLSSQEVPWEEHASFDVK